ncbi:hypothetical protein NIE79_006470 [Micromonospora sp. NIE79]|uniref:Uncharacterized protein n=1 Tax=Micromonospora trifolii TaxID=2911208 RepID=A0ABS9NC42_9ACTN|nr:hypothetical protein [Micromonospora trifolii]MCG5447534.1 hypothetical protein [Micromonospora trifolii]
MASVAEPPAGTEDLSPREPARGQDPPVQRSSGTWTAVATVVLVLGGAAGLLVTGHTLHESLIGAGGLALIGGQVARRIVADAGPLPTIVVAFAVAAFGAVIYLQGATLTEAVAGAGVGGFAAGEIAARMFGTDPRPHRSATRR